MGLAVIFVMTSASAITWLLHAFVLAPLALGYLQTITFVLVIATFVQFVELVLKKTVPVLHKALGIFLPLITTNCAVLGVTVQNIRKGHTFLQSLVFSFGAALGFALVLIIFTSLRMKIDRANPPKAFQGLAVALITAGLLGLAFMAFSNMVKL